MFIFLRLPPEQVLSAAAFQETDGPRFLSGQPVQVRRFPAPRCTGGAMGWRCLLRAVPTGSGEPTLPKRDDWKGGKSGGEGSAEKERHCALQKLQLTLLSLRRKIVYFKKKKKKL